MPYNKGYDVMRLLVHFSWRSLWLRRRKTLATDLSNV